MALQNGIEQDEAEYAVEIEEDETQNKNDEYAQQDQSEKLADMLRHVRRVEAWKSPRQARLHDLVLMLGRSARPSATKIGDAASADMNFRCKNSDQREPRPLSPSEVGEELCARVLQSGLDAINGGDGQWEHLKLEPPRYRGERCGVNGASPGFCWMYALFRRLVSVVSLVCVVAGLRPAIGAEPRHHTSFQPGFCSCWLEGFVLQPVSELFQGQPALQTAAFLPVSDFAV